MSVCRKLPDGTVQKIAGHTILLDANASEVRSGTITIDIPTTNQYSGIVTFSDPMPDTDYIVVLNVLGWNEDGNIFGTPWRISPKTTTGFTITGWKADSSRTTQVTFEWTAFKPIKLDGYTALQNKINNPDETPTKDSMNLVTSDGVYEAIKNASAVWKGTKAAWNALPAAEKQTYDLAVLLDETLVKAVDREDGTETDVANLNKIVHLTKAEYDAMPSHDPDTYYMITDDVIETLPASIGKITELDVNATVTPTGSDDIPMIVESSVLEPGTYIARFSCYITHNNPDFPVYIFLAIGTSKGTAIGHAQDLVPYTGLWLTGTGFFKLTTATSLKLFLGSTEPNKQYRSTGQIQIMQIR